ncbi:hypothetical protein [Pseudoclavibacter terrae]|nr:hypothetical protein [Pseudoclavibacter terrae]
MDISSMIMGAAIASVMWIGFVPWARLKRLREHETQAVARDAGEGPSSSS